MSICPNCRATFICCVADQTDLVDGETCWCMRLPAADVGTRAREDNSTDEIKQGLLCMCPACLQAISPLGGGRDAKPADA